MTFDYVWIFIGALFLVVYWVAQEIVRHKKREEEREKRLQLLEQKIEKKD
jgi:hypothetical protein